MTQRIRVKVELTVDVDVDAWRDLYGSTELDSAQAVRRDVRHYVYGLVMNSAAAEERAITGASVHLGPPLPLPPE